MNLCYLIAAQLYQYRALRASEQGLARQQDDSAYWTWQFQSSRDYFAKFHQPTIWDSDPPSQRWQDCRSLHDRPGEHLNKFTIAKFRKSMQASKFSDWQLKVEGFSAHRHPFLAAFNFLTRIPLIEEVYHSAIFGKLTKEASHCSSVASNADSSHPLRRSA